MRFHSIVGLVTNSSSESFTFSGLGRSQADVDLEVSTLWLEFCLDANNEDDLRIWWDMTNWDGKRYHEAPFSREAVIAHGSPIHFRACEDGSFEYFTIMNNLEAPELFAQFVVGRMNSNPIYSGAGIMRSVCSECMRSGLATCPPCRLR